MDGELKYIIKMVVVRNTRFKIYKDVILSKCCQRKNRNT